MACVQASAKRGGAKSKKFELTEEQKQEIREAFDLFDTDGSGQSCSSSLSWSFVEIFEDQTNALRSAQYHVLTSARGQLAGTPRPGLNSRLIVATELHKYQQTPAAVVVRVKFVLVRRHKDNLF